MLKVKAKDSILMYDERNLTIIGHKTDKAIFKNKKLRKSNCVQSKRK